MGIYISKLGWNNKDYFAGYSTITDRFFTKAYEDPKDVSINYPDDFKPENVPTTDNIAKLEYVFSLTSDDITRISATIEKMKNGDTTCTQEERTALQNFYSVLQTILGYSDTGFPEDLQDSVNDWCQSLGIDNEEGDIYGVVEGSIDNALDTDSAMLMEDEAYTPDAKLVKFTGLFMEYLLNILNNADSSPIELLNKTY